jgi:hypothetical protein
MGEPATQTTDCQANLDAWLQHEEGWRIPNLVLDGGVEFGPRPGGPNATPFPSSALLARGDFIHPGRGAVEFLATGEGSSVTGRMTVRSGDALFAVDLQCTRTTGDGLIMIGGVTMDANAGGSRLSPEGTFASVIFRLGPPVQAEIWSERGGHVSRAASCQAYLDAVLVEQEQTGGRGTAEDGENLSPIEGTIELGP